MGKVIPMDSFEVKFDFNCLYEQGAISKEVAYVANQYFNLHLGQETEPGYIPLTSELTNNDICELGDLFLQMAQQFGYNKQQAKQTKHFRQKRLFEKMEDAALTIVAVLVAEAQNRPEFIGEN